MNEQTKRTVADEVLPKLINEYFAAIHTDAQNLVPVRIPERIEVLLSSESLRPEVRSEFLV